jgi:hypothetical protein
MYFMLDSLILPNLKLRVIEYTYIDYPSMFFMIVIYAQSTGTAHSLLVSYPSIKINRLCTNQATIDSIHNLAKGAGPCRRLDYTALQ